MLQCILFDSGCPPCSATPPCSDTAMLHLVRNADGWLYIYDCMDPTCRVDRRGRSRGTLAVTTHRVDLLQLTETIRCNVPEETGMQCSM